MEHQTSKEGAISLPRHFSGVAVRKIVDEVNSGLKRGEKDINLDFCGVETIDSFGIGQLVFITKSMKETGAHLTLNNLNEPIYRLFKETGLDQLFAIEGVNRDVIEFFESSIDIRLDITQESEGDIRVLKMAGVMDHLGGSRYFRQQVLLSLATYNKILLDLTDLTFFDSMSVSIVLDMHKLLRDTGGQLKMCAANYIVEDLFNTLNLGAIIPFYRTRAEAVAGWKQA